MRLTHIKLSGFKSFTDSTVIPVPGKLVAVIGPNGCGKSNVIDAVRWVLGEASAKQLRGENMQDVIFNGAATRKPAPRASVELVFDNSAHTLQGAWGKYSEISIKRRLNRQGESTYFINGQIVRRRDITDLFLGTGVGARGYAVIEQGMITRIIEARPEELRTHIEEAAGVSKYKERRRETENRLTDTREHLQRLHDLQQELSRQTEKLEQQATAAKQYQTLKKELAHLNDLSDFILWQQALSDADKAEIRHHKAQTHLEQAEEQINQYEEQNLLLRQTQQEQQQHLHAHNQEHAILREQTARLEEQLNAQLIQHKRLMQERQNADAALHKLKQEHTKLQETATETEQLIQLAQKEQEEAEAATEEWQQLIPQYEHNWQETETARQHAQTTLTQTRHQAILYQQQMHHIKQTFERQQARLMQLRQSTTVTDNHIHQALNNATTETNTLQAQYQILDDLLHQNTNNITTQQQTIYHAEQFYQQLQQRFLNAQATEKAFKHLLSEHAKHDFWAHIQQHDASILWQHIHVNGIWRHATQIILSERLNTRSFTKAFALPIPLPEGEALWLHGALTNTHVPLPDDALLQHIHISSDSPFTAAIYFWLNGIRCANTLDIAIQQQHELATHQIWLTPEGHCVDPISIHLYDTTAAPLPQSRFAEYAYWQNERQTLEPKLTEATKKLTQERETLNNLQTQTAELTAKQRQLTTKLQQSRHQLAQWSAQLKHNQEQHDQITKECHVLEQECDNLALELTTTEELLINQQTLAEQTETHYQTLIEQSQQHQNVLQQARLAQHDAQNRLHTAQITLQHQEQRAEQISLHLKQLTEQITDWQERQSQLMLFAEEAFIQEEKNTRLEQLNELSTQLQEQIDGLQQQLHHTQQQLNDSETIQRNVKNHLPQLQTEVNNALLSQQEALLTAKRYYDALLSRQNNHLTETELNEIWQHLKTEAEQADSIRSMGQRTARIRHAIETLGAVNLTALDELAAAREREQYYRSQSEDLQAAVARLEEAITQIDNETKNRFQHTFDAVNTHMQHYFPTLFGGGEAHLNLVGEDLLRAGVSISARPPGKKNSTIHLLSGGEKALTAMSLVFALFSLNPAPFCLLDEVDAPLDDANTARFCELVRQMSAHTQFLYISHNRLTMEMAEQLIGVTMQEKGVSRIVAVDIKQALAMAQNNQDE